MALPPAFKTDESFLEKIVMGARATQRTFQDLERQGHEPIELERGSMSFKIWKAIKTKRVRVPDILCLRCGHRVESRGKRKLEITMSHSTSNPERGWDAGLDDADAIALFVCERAGPSPVDWIASDLVQYLPVKALRKAYRANLVKAVKPKGVGEGFEVRLTWPSAVAKADGVVVRVEDDGVVLQDGEGPTGHFRLNRRPKLIPRVVVGDRVRQHQIVASVVPVSTSFLCVAGAGLQSYLDLTRSSSLSDRYTAAKALRRFGDQAAAEALLNRLQDDREHVYVRLEAAAGLLARGNADGRDFFAAMLNDDYLERRLEAVIVLGEVATEDAVRLLIGTLADPAQPAGIRAGAAWALGATGDREAVRPLIESFNALETEVKVEAARALANLGRRYHDDLVAAFPTAAADQRPGVAWALSKAGGVTIRELLGALVDDDARSWVAYVLGTQDPARLVPEVEDLARRDPEVYFAVTVLWKILASWVYGLEEY
jgi:HEAT repeat protein